MKKSTKRPSLEWSREAENDVAHIIEYIKERNPKAALELLSLIDEKVEKLPENPQIHRPGRVSGTREMLIKPSHVLIYKEEPKMVRILRVLHTSQMWPA